MPPIYYFPSEDCCPRGKLRVQGGWRHEWSEPGTNVPREVIRGPFSKPLLVCSTPFVLLNEADSGRKLGHTRTGIPDPWAEYLAQQTQGRSRLGEENVAIVDNAYRKLGVPFCQGIPDPWRNRPCFLEASFDELQKCDNVSTSDSWKRPINNNNIPPRYVIREYPKERGNISICEPRNCLRKHSIPQTLSCKCALVISPQQFTEQLQPQLQKKTPQTLYKASPEICSCDLQKSIPIQLPSNESSLKPQVEPLKREIIKPCYCTGIETKIQPASPPIKSKSNKKKCCPISKYFQRPKKKQHESPNKNITNQKLVAVPDTEPIGDGQNVLLMCWQNCKCNSRPCKLICTNVNLRDSGQVQVPLICQCSHTTDNSANDIANNPEKLPASAYNLPMIMSCPCDDTTGSFKNDSPDPNDIKPPQPQIKDKKLQTPEKLELQTVDANKNAKKKKVSLTDKQNDTTDLQGTDNDKETHSRVEDERNKGR